MVERYSLVKINNDIVLFLLSKEMGKLTGAKMNSLASSWQRNTAPSNTCMSDFNSWNCYKVTLVTIAFTSSLLTSTTSALPCLSSSPTSWWMLLAVYRGGKINPLLKRPNLLKLSLAAYSQPHLPTTLSNMNMGVTWLPWWSSSNTSGSCRCGWSIWSHDTPPDIFFPSPVSTRSPR